MLELLKSGGPVMIPLVLCSVVALAITVEKLWNLRQTKILGSESFETLVALIEGGRVDKAAEMCRRKPGIWKQAVAEVFQAADPVFAKSNRGDFLEIQWRL